MGLCGPANDLTCALWTPYGLLCKAPGEARIQMDAMSCALPLPISLMSVRDDVVSGV